MCTAAALACSSSATAHLPSQQSSERRVERIDQRSPCLSPLRLPEAYGWPVKPFDQQHPVRGNFGDPRTLFFGGISGGSNAVGVFQFHNGVDISAPDDSPVYPVESGRVARVAADHVAIAAEDGRHFQYWHIRPSVRPGESVTVDETVLGHILPEFQHVHLTEIDKERVTNPLVPGHLFPYHDNTPPRVDGVRFTWQARNLGPGELHGIVTITAAAHDDPSPPPPGHWRHAPVTPALMSWSLSRDGSIVRGPGTVFDVRRTLPPTRDFWRIYAPGTIQNFPVSAQRHLTAKPGTYIFNIAELDTRRFPNGDYMLTVEASDVCGNTGSLTTAVTIEN
jgi:hypothetical protein